jgi:hypothetical protein
LGHISFVGKLEGETLKGGAPVLTPGWTLDLMAKHSLDFWLTSEDLPDPDNRVTLDEDGGIVLSYKPNNAEGHKRLIAKLEELMQQQTRCSVHGDNCHQGLFARNLFVAQRIPLAGGAHQVGTVRFGIEFLEYLNPKNGKPAPTIFGIGRLHWSRRMPRWPRAKYASPAAGPFPPQRRYFRKAIWVSERVFSPETRTVTACRSWKSDCYHFGG